MRQRGLLEAYIFNGAIAIASASLSVNAWLIKERVAEMTSTLNDISVKIGDLRTDQASIKEQVHSNTVAVERLQRRQDRGP